MQLEKIHSEDFRVSVSRAQFGTYNIDREGFDSFDIPDFGGSSLNVYKKTADKKGVRSFQIFYFDGRDMYKALYIKPNKQWKLVRVMNCFTAELVWAERTLGNKRGIEAGESAALKDIESGFVDAETAEDVIFDAECNCRQSEKAGDSLAGDFWFAYGTTIEKHFS